MRPGPGRRWSARPRFLTETWSYLYRHVIPPLVAAGYRCVAPDLIGFGKSDKLTDRFACTYQNHVDWLGLVVFDRLDLRDLTLVCHDWGGLLGLRLLAEHPDRFRRVVATNTSLPTGDRDPSGPLSIWLQLSQRSNPFVASQVVDRGTVTELDPAVRAAYDAPFPDESYLQGARQFPLLIPLTPYDEATAANREAWSVLRTLSIPFLYAHADHDWGVGEGRAIFSDGITGAEEVVIENSLDKLASVTLIPALVCTLVLAVLTMRTRGNDRWLVVGSFGLLALVLVTTLVINLPINGDQADWSVQSPPSDWASVREGCPRGTYCLCRIGVRCADRCRGQPYDSV